MAILRFACPGCGKPLKKSRPGPTRRVECPHCGHRFVPPVSDDTRSPNAARSTPSGNGGPPEDEDGRRPEVPGYVILDELGQGADAVVYKARQTSLGRLVALKMILRGALADKETVARFRAEATAVARLQHPHIVQVFEVGEHRGLNFLALELVDGPTLARRLAGSPQPPLPAAELIETLARAVSLAHQRNIIHRDLKPGNVLLALPDLPPGATPDESHAPGLYGVPKITDFGIAKRLDADASHTKTGAVMGTPCYMAPEQARGDTGKVGPAADVYALGAILYEMLTGRPPFKGATTLETIAMVLDDEPVAPRRLQPYVPRDLETICLKCLQKDESRRYPSALALAEDLARFRAGEAIHARPPGAGERLWRWCRRNPVPASLLVAMVFCLVCGFQYLSHLSDRLVRSAALESAAQQSDMLLEVNNSYSDVVKRATAGKLPVTHDYLDKPTAIPIPATFTIELGQQISDRSQTGMQIRLYSDYPFRGRRGGGPRDEFERAALARLRASPDDPYYSFEEYQGRPVLRYATSRRMEQTCVDCHNTHPDSPRTDWKVGDVRGVVEIIHPLDKDAARTHQGLQGAFVLVAVVCVSLLSLSGLILFVGRLKRRRGEPKV